MARPFLFRLLFTSDSKSLGRYKYIRLLILCILLISFASLLVIIYLRNEHYFYYWDYDDYVWGAIQRTIDFSRAPLSALKAIYQTINDDYNYFFVLPLIPFIWLSKFTRLGVILSVTLVYQIPLFIVVGLIAKKLISSKSNVILWISCFIGFTLPTLWTPTLRGYPDIGAVLIIAIAVLIYIQDISLRKWWRVPVIGFLCALVAIFRRHFIYNIIAFFISIGLTLFYNYLNRWKHMTEKYYNKLVVKATQLRTYKKWEHIIREFHFETGKQALKLGGIGLSCLLTLLFIARPFLQRMISIDYLVLYQSYEQTVSTVVNFFVTDYGVVIILFTITALAIGAYRRLLDSSVTLFLALFGTLSTLLWAVIPRQIGVQYPLHLALVVILGLTAFGRILWSIPNLPIRWIGITSFTGILILNMIAGLAPIKLPSEVSGALALNHPPLFREDYNEVVSLVAYLRQITKSNNMIYIVDSSGLMNFDLVQKAERDLYGFKNTKLYIPFSAQVDSRDFYPLELLIRADYIVITTPLQTHLGENQQKVVKYVFDAFEQNWEIARDFKRLPVEFKLSNGAILSIYKRQNNTSFETSLATFNQMVKYVDRIPGNQDDWILVSRNYYGHAIKNVNQNYSFILIPSDEIPDTRAIFLFAKPLPAFGNVQGKVYFLNNQCSQVSVSLRQFQVSGNLLTEKNQVVSKNSGTFELSFQSQVGTNNILVLDAQNDYQTPSEKFCSFRLEWK